MAGWQGNVIKLILAPTVLFISVWVKTLAPVETRASCQQKEPAKTLEQWLFSSLCGARFLLSKPPNFLLPTCWEPQEVPLSTGNEPGEEMLIDQ